MYCSKFNINKYTELDEKVVAILAFITEEIRKLVFWFNLLDIHWN